MPAIRQLVAHRFELLEVAGRGGMGVVYRARDHQTGADVAVKLLSRFADPMRVNGAWLDEVAALEALRPIRGVPRLIGAGMTGSSPYVAMAWADGHTLAADSAGPGATLGRAVLRVADLLEILADIHEAGWTHGDVNPANVLVGDAGVTLIDFGLARSTAGAGATQGEEVSGTPGFMAPEVARGSLPTVASDIYSVGATLHAILTGEAPVRGSTPFSIIVKLLDDEPAPERSPRVTGNAALDRVVRRALRRDPAARFASALEMRRALLLALDAARSAGETSLPLNPPRRELAPGTEPTILCAGPVARRAPRRPAHHA